MKEEKSPFDRYREALRLFDEGRFEEAEPLARQVTVDVPDYSDGWFLLAQTVSELGRGVEAAALCKQLAKELPDDVALYDVWAESLDGLEDPGEEREVLARALALDPGRDDAAAKIAELDCRLHKTGRAVKLLRKQMKQSGRNAALLTALGECYVHDGRFDEAEKSFREALVLDPDHEKARRQLGTLKKQEEGIEETAEAPLEADDAPEAPETPVSREVEVPDMLVLERQVRGGELKQVISVVEAYLTSGGRDPDLEVFLAECYERISRRHDAVLVCRSLLGRRPEKVEAQVLLGRLLRKEGEYETAAEALREAMQSDRTREEASVELALVYREAGDFRKAREAFEESLRAIPEAAYGREEE